MRPRSIARPAAGRRALLRLHLRRRPERARAVRHRPVHPDPVGHPAQKPRIGVARAQDRRPRRDAAPPSAAPSAPRPAAGPRSSRCRSSATAAGSRSTATAPTRRGPLRAARARHAARARRRCACASPPSRACVRVGGAPRRQAPRLPLAPTPRGTAPACTATAPACGQTLGYGTLGVAHKSLPCGAKVTFKKGAPRGHACRVIDRGPYVGGREYDLTGATARSASASAATAPSSPPAEPEGRPRHHRDAGTSPRSSGSAS